MSLPPDPHPGLPLSLLVVDDEDVVLDIMKKYLTSFFSFRVECTPSGSAALELLTKNQYDAIISDYEMKEMTGVDLVRIIRSQGNDTPFILFTGKGREYVVIEAYENGADGYVQKGSDIKAQFTELAHKITSAVDKRNAERKLKDSERHYRILAENITDVVWVLDPESGYFKYVSPSVERLRGYTPEEILALPVDAALSVESSAYVQRLIQTRIGRFLEGLQSPPYYVDEIEQPCKDGSFIWTEVVTNYYRNEETGKVEVRGVTRDITERKKSENVISEYVRGLERISRHSIELLDLEDDSQVYATIGTAILDLTPPGTIVITSQVDPCKTSITTRSVLGLSDYSRSIIGDFADSLPGIRYPVSEGSMERMLTGKIHEIPFDLRTLTSGIFPEEVYHRIEESQFFQDMYSVGLSWKNTFFGAIILLLPPGGGIANRSLIENYIQVAALELQRRQVSTTLKEERNLFIGGPVVMFQWSTQEGWPALYVSPNITSQFGYAPEEFLEGRILFSDIIHPDDLAGLQKDISQYHKKGLASFEREFRLRMKDGTFRWVYDYTVVQRSQTGSPDLLHGYILDIDERKRVGQLLKESEEYARILINAPKESIFMVDPLGVVLYVNETAASRLGYTVDEMLGKSVFQFLPPDIADQRRGYFETVLSSGKSIQTLDEDSGFVIEYNIYPIPDERGNISHIAVYGRDITEKIESDRRLLESEAKYRQLVQNAKSIIIRFDRDGNVEFFNEYGQDFFGFSEKELKEKGLVGTILNEKESTGRDMRDMMTDIFRNPESYLNNENENVCKDGRTVWIAWRNRPVYEDGVFVGMLSVGTDITERKQIEEALTQREQFLINIFSSIQDGISILDTDLHIIRVNPTMERWYAHATPLIGRKCYEAYHGSSKICDNCPSSFALATGKAAREVVPKRGNNQQIEGWLELYSFPLIDDRTGNRSGVIEYVRDISDRRFVEESLKQANLKLNLLSSITRHDVLNLITALRGYQDISQEIIMDGVLKDYLQKQILITESIQSQIEFTKDYQDLGVRSPTWQDVAECINEVRRRIDLSGITFHLNIANLQVFADPLFIKVFYTLMENGIRHGERVSAMCWNSFKEGNEVHLIYEDDGIGVLDIDKERIFIRGVGSHTGLGLFLSQEILAITGMTIRENGLYGKGARFEIIIPEGVYRLSEGNDEDNAYLPTHRE